MLHAEIVSNAHDYTVHDSPRRSAVNRVATTHLHAQFRFNTQTRVIVEDFFPLLFGPILQHKGEHQIATEANTRWSITGHSAKLSTLYTTRKPFSTLDAHRVVHDYTEKTSFQ